MEKQFVEIVPYTDEEITKLKADYAYAVKHLAVNVTFESYVAELILQKIITTGTI